MEKKVEGKVAIVVGATRGIGRAIAVRMSNLGMKIATIARNKEELAALKEEINSQGVEFLEIKGNITDFNALGEAFQQVWDQYGRFDVLVSGFGRNRRDDAG